jgi:hypothetical protein
VLQAGVPGWLAALARGPAVADGDAAGALAVSGLELRRVAPGPGAVALAPEILPLAQQADLTLLLANLVVSRRGGRA